MQIDRYRFELGDFECLAIRDVTATGGDAGWFPNIPSEVSHPILQKQNINPDSFDHTMTCLAVNTGTDWVLLDTGMGFVRGDWMREDPKLKQILEEENIQPRHIILTHLDLDHYAGLINTDNTPAFPNADVHICREAWELFTSATFYEGNDTYDRREHLFLVKDQIRLIECAGEVLPGFSMISFPGHREHHLGIEVESNGEKLLFAADTVCHPLQIEHIDWQFHGDTDHDIARESHIKLAQMTSESGCLVLLYHFDFPGLGHIIQDGDGWKWQPVEQ